MYSPSDWERVGFSIAFTDIAAEIGLTDTQKGSVFSAFFFGYALTQVLGGYLASRYGGNKTLALSFVLWVPLSAITALPSGSPDQVVASVFACRLVIGMAQGILLPSSDLVLAHWIPSSARGRFFAFAVSGKFLGAAVSMVTVPIIVSDVDATATFYIAACLGAAWLAVWVVAGSDAPPASEEATARCTEAARDSGGLSMYTRTGAELAEYGGGGGGGGGTDGGSHEHRTQMSTATSLASTLNGESDGLDEHRPEIASATSPDSTPYIPALNHPELCETPGLFHQKNKASSAAVCGSLTGPRVLENEHSSPVRDVGDSSSSRIMDGGMDSSTGKQWSEIQERASSAGGTPRSNSNETISTGLNSIGRRTVDVSGEKSGDKRWGVFRERSGSKGSLCRSSSESRVATGDGSPNSEVLASRISSGGSGRAVGSGQENMDVGDRRVLMGATPDVPQGAPPAKDTITTGGARTKLGRDQVKSRTTFPWRKMAASPAAWACVAANIGATVGINVVMSWLPTYFEEFFLVDLRDLGIVLLVTPYLTMMAFSILGGYLYCWLTNTLGMTASRAFKLITGGSFASAICFFLSMGRATSTSTGVLFSSLALASMALSRGGWSTYHVEVASLKYTAVLYSVANTASSIASVFGIAVTGKLLHAYGGAGEAKAWVVAMGVVGSICGACGIFFVVFAKGNEVLFPSVAPRHEVLFPPAASRRGEDFETVIE